MSMTSTCLPFFFQSADADPVVQWFRVPEAKATLERIGTLRFHSCLYLYGSAQRLTPDVDLTALDSCGRVLWEGNTSAGRMHGKGATDRAAPTGTLRCVLEVPYLDSLPACVVIAGSGGSSRETRVQCTSHRFFGTIADFDERPFRAFVAVFPDTFDAPIGVWSDDNGHYDIQLPERTYTAVAVDDESYGISSTETWAWHIVHESDQSLDFKVGNTEIYNLHAWANCGGGQSHFVSFRPMSLAMYARIGAPKPVQIGGRTGFGHVDLSPPIGPEDLFISLNSVPVPIHSLQAFFETPTADTAMQSYVAQIGTGGIAADRKQTLRVELKALKPLDKEQILHRGMGYCQFLPSPTGQSGYF